MVKGLTLAAALAVAGLALLPAQAQSTRATQAERWMIPMPPADGSYYASDPTTYMTVTNVGSQPAHVTTRFYNRGVMYGPGGSASEPLYAERVGVVVPPGGTATFRDKAGISEFQVVLSDEPVIVNAWVLRGPLQPGGGGFMPTDAIALSCSGEHAGALACSAPLTALAQPVLAPGSPRARQAPAPAIAPGAPR
jgi:hypothetical protein